MNEEEKMWIKNVESSEDTIMKDLKRAIEDDKKKEEQEKLKVIMKSVKEGNKLSEEEINYVLSNMIHTVDKNKQYEFRTKLNGKEADYYPNNPSKKYDDCRISSQLIIKGTEQIQDTADISLGIDFDKFRRMIGNLINEEEIDWRNVAVLGNEDSSLRAKIENKKKELEKKEDQRS